MFAPGPRACVSGSWEMIQAKDLDYLGRRIIKKAMIKKKKKERKKKKAMIIILTSLAHRMGLPGQKQKLPCEINKWYSRKKIKNQGTHCSFSYPYPSDSKPAGENKSKPVSLRDPGIHGNWEFKSFKVLSPLIFFFPPDQYGFTPRQP